MHPIAAAALLVLLPAIAGAEAPPWKRTETREPCARYDRLRAPYVGDLHIHTAFSADAYIFGTRVGPRDAYDFARGTTIPVADAMEEQTRSATIDRPLDFAAVTDHAELFGEVNLCTTPGSPVFDIEFCQILRLHEATPVDELFTTIRWLFPLGVPDLTPNRPTSEAFCSETPGVDCDAAAVSVWQEIQAAAEEAYDRTSSCGFTSFIGYEHTPSPLGRHLHRNVIFRNEHVPAFAASALDTIQENALQGLWTAIESGCTGAGTGCEAVIIPHNSNLSGGEQFIDPLDAADAFRRQTLEPLVEIHQVKGNSECRFDRLAGAGVGTADELCTFEQRETPFEGPDGTAVSIDKYPRRNLVRPTLEDGLGFERTLGVNPFRFGFVGSTDTHNATAGDTEEQGWGGIQGQDDASPARMISDNMRNNPGGLTVVWAEENSRDAIFSALQRRETYATSGTRPIVRFFGGDLSGVECGKADFVARAYTTGTPMGGDVGPVRGKKSPRFALWAMKDPQGTDLQRVQIVKGWADADGTTHDQTFDVAGNAANGAGVDPTTCAPTGTGAADLCAVWTDPDFDPAQHAFYYARVVENPTCRWSTRICQQAGVDPFAADCAARAAAAPPEFADCCLGKTNDAFLDPTIQERAWTSPIWYRPETFTKAHGRVRFAQRGGSDTVALRATLGGLPKDFDPVANGLTVRVTNGDDLLALVAAPGAVRRKGRRFVYKDASPATVSLTLGRKGDAVLLVRASSRDLAAVAREDQIVTVSLASGLFRAAQTRMWAGSARQLAFGGR